jgi:hypothetical protein
MVVVLAVFVVVFVVIFGGLLWVQRGHRRDPGSTLARRRLRLVRIAWLGLGILLVVVWLQQR